MAVNIYSIYSTGELLTMWREKVAALDGLRSSSVNGKSFQPRDAQLGQVQREINQIGAALYDKDPDTYADYASKSVALPSFTNLLP
jgi:hypothetical protein